MTHQPTSTTLTQYNCSNPGHEPYHNVLTIVLELIFLNDRSTIYSGLEQ